MNDRLSRRDLLGTLGVAATAPATTALAGCSASGSSAIVTMQSFDFHPRRLRVGQGTTVEWVNDSGIPHTVTAYEDRIPDDADYFATGGYQSERAARNDISGGLLDADDSYTHTFEKPGVYEYYCIPHESSGMLGEIIIE